MKKTASVTGDTDVTKYYGIDHLEFSVGDAGTIARNFRYGLGLKLVEETNWDTGNYAYCSYVLQTRDVKFILTSAYLSEIHGEEKAKHKQPNPTFSAARYTEFFTNHGNGVSAVGLRIDNVQEAYNTIISRGAKGIIEPTEIKAEDGTSVVIAEILVYNDEDFEGLSQHLTEVYQGINFKQSHTVFRLIQYNEYKGAFLPGYSKVDDKNEDTDFGFQRIDHIVGNVYRMDKVVQDMKNWFGFHTFAFFTPEEIRTKWTSLNSEVLASNHAEILLPINEPAPGKKESQILKYLKAYNGPGLQHIAIKTKDIFETLTKMRKYNNIDLLATPLSYYDTDYINQRIRHCADTGATFADFELLKAELMKLNILIDQDENGILLQIFTKPLFDRPTIFIEIIQRICFAGEEIPGCGRFGQGNFKALFESLERFFEGKSAASSEDAGSPYH